MSESSKHRERVKSNDTLVASWIAYATQSLKMANITSARLDVELILAHAMRRSRTWLHAHSHDVIDAISLSIAEACLTLRLDHVPIAYIIGHKEFYGRRFHVSPATLIPRPESETIIFLIGRLIEPAHCTLLDVGTGSGCLGITAKLEYPVLDATLSDVSTPALEIAELNAKELRADVTCIHSDLLENITGSFDFIVANLPYVDQSWEVSPDIAHEPALALFAEDGGLALIKRLLTQVATHITPHGYLLLEADPCQHDEIIAIATKNGYLVVAVEDYIVALSRA